MKGIGNTPLIKLQKLTDPNSADIYVKFEGSNLTGSMKDRMALSMIEGAEKRGELKKGMKVVEYTGGSTGSSLAMICAIKGYEAHFVSSNGFAKEKLQTMRAFGATVEIIPAENGILTAEVINRMIARAKEIIKEPNTYWVNQINNPDNKLGYHPMGEEILSELGTNIDEFVMAVGGGGCISGNSEILKARIPKMKTVGVEPFSVRNISGGDTTGSHKLEGIGLSFIPSILRKDLIDEIISVTDADAYKTANDLAKKEGIFGGATSGANVWAALQRAQIIGKGKKIVTAVCDSGIKYLQGDLYE
ncbi:MAG: cysteine synthase family protein [Cytophagia bacterium]|nr:cysteine synthase family protein [Paracoccaceae bacterium]NVK83179.1 cysteine synthase family protein [Cytophagia bacterium]